MHIMISGEFVSLFFFFILLFTLHRLIDNIYIQPKKQILKQFIKAEKKLSILDKNGGQNGLGGI